MTDKQPEDSPAAISIPFACLPLNTSIVAVWLLRRQQPVL